MYNVLNCIRATSNPACRPFKITEELIDLSTMAIEFFKSDLEPLMPQIGALKHFYDKSSTTTRKIFHVYIVRYSIFLASITKKAKATVALYGTLQRENQLKSHFDVERNFEEKKLFLGKNYFLREKLLFLSQNNFS